VVGYGDGGVANKLEPQRLNTGITIVGKRARIPAGLHVGRNCMIDAAVTESDFHGATTIPSGESILAAPAPRLSLAPQAAAS
jgi:glucose-1-phosphate adenylyltransferase